MNETDIVLGFIRTCTRGHLGFSECSPVFALGGIALAVVILLVALAALRINHAKTQAGRQTGP